MCARNRGKIRTICRCIKVKFILGSGLENNMIECFLVFGLVFGTIIGFIFLSKWAYNHDVQTTRREIAKIRNKEHTNNTNNIQEARKYLVRWKAGEIVWEELT